MPIQARVGRHNKQNGRHCQNWADDQRIIVGLLNRIPAHQGGAGGTLKPRLVAGIASDDLFAAILRFEDAHFPGQRSGFVDPSGQMLKRLEVLADSSHTQPLPEPDMAEPTAIDDLLDMVERIKSNPNYPAVKVFLLRLKAQGYTKPIQNDRIRFYLFGVLRFVRGHSTSLPERVHIATPFFEEDAIRADKKAGVVFLSNARLGVLVNGKLEYIDALRVRIGRVVLEKSPVVTIGRAVLEEPVEITIGRVVIEK